MLVIHLLAIRDHFPTINILYDNLGIIARDQQKFHEWGQLKKIFHESVQVQTFHEQGRLKIFWEWVYVKIICTNMSKIFGKSIS